MTEYEFKCVSCHNSKVTRSGLYCLVCSEDRGVQLSDAVRLRVLIRIAGKNLNSWLISDCK